MYSTSKINNLYKFPFLRHANSFLLAKMNDVCKAQNPCSNFLWRPLYFFDLAFLLTQTYFIFYSVCSLNYKIYSKKKLLSYFCIYLLYCFAVYMASSCSTTNFNWIYIYFHIVIYRTL